MTFVPSKSDPMVFEIPIGATRLTPQKLTKYRKLTSNRAKSNDGSFILALLSTTPNFNRNCVCYSKTKAHCIFAIAFKKSQRTNILQ